MVKGCLGYIGDEENVERIHGEKKRSRAEKRIEKSKVPVVWNTNTDWEEEGGRRWQGWQKRNHWDVFFSFTSSV